MPTKTVIAATTIVTKEEGEKVEYAPGSEVTLEAQEADGLVARGLARVPAPAPVEDEDLEAVVEVIRALDRDDSSLFTDKGEPRADVLTERLGRAVSARERDLALAAIAAEAE